MDPAIASDATGQPASGFGAAPAGPAEPSGPTGQHAAESPWSRPPARTPGAAPAAAAEPAPVSPAAPQSWAPATAYPGGFGSASAHVPPPATAEHGLTTDDYVPAADGYALAESSDPAGVANPTESPNPVGYALSDYPSLSEHPIPAQESKSSGWSVPDEWAPPADRWTGSDEGDWAGNDPVPWPGAPAVARDGQPSEQSGGQHTEQSGGQHPASDHQTEAGQTAAAAAASQPADPTAGVGSAVVPVPVPPPQASGYTPGSAASGGAPTGAPTSATASSYPEGAAVPPVPAGPYPPGSSYPPPASPYPGVTQVPQRPYPEAAGVVRIPTHPATAQPPAPPQPSAAPPGIPPAPPASPPSPAAVSPGQPGGPATAKLAQPASGYPEAIWTPDGSVPTAEEFARRRAARPAEPVATMGVRAAVNKTTLGLVRLPPGRHEQEIRRDIEMVRRNFGGLRQVTVVNPKGGAGKTVAILLLAMTFGQKRGGYVLAWDNNETQGTLGMRAQQDFHARTVRDLLRDLSQFQGAHGRVGDLSQYVRSQGEGMFDVLASDESATGGEMLTAAAFGEIREVVSRFYKLIFVDTGNNVRAQNWQAAIDATDQLLVTMSARNDSAETAARMLDHLEQSGRQRLVRQAVTVVSMPPSRKDIDLPPIQRHFAARTRAVLLAPYERLIDTGEPIRYGQLSSATRDAWLKIAAAVAEGL